MIKELTFQWGKRYLKNKAVSAMAETHKCYGHSLGGTGGGCKTQTQSESASCRSDAWAESSGWSVTNQTERRIGQILAKKLMSKSKEEVMETSIRCCLLNFKVQYRECCREFGAMGRKSQEGPLTYVNMREPIPTVKTEHIHHCQKISLASCNPFPDPSHRLPSPPMYTGDHWSAFCCYRLIFIF